MSECLTKSATTKFIKDLSSSKISMEEFKEKLTKFAIDNEIISKSEALDESSLKDHILTRLWGYSELALGATNIVVCNENAYIKADIGECKVLGFMEINGFHFLGVSIFGDWEWPVYTILYFSNKDSDKLERYIPLKGNSYNPEYMTAFGSEQDSPIWHLPASYTGDEDDFDWYEYTDEDEYQDIMEPDLDDDLIIEDIKKAFNL